VEFGYHRLMIEEHSVQIGTPGAWTESWHQLTDGSVAHQFEYVVSHHVWLSREDSVSDDGIAVPGEMLIHVDSHGGMDSASARALAVELAAAVELLDG
jgi:hypothetical protein